MVSVDELFGGEQTIDTLVDRVNNCEGGTSESGLNGWAAQKTAEYFDVRSWTTYTSEQLHSVFSKYERATNDGEKLTLIQLGEDAGIRFPQVSNILKAVKLKTMHRTIENQLTVTAEEKIMLERSLQITDMSDPDIAYFMGLPSHVVGRYSRKHGKERNGRIMMPSKNLPPYRISSQIYAERAKRRGVDKIAVMLGIDKQKVRAALLEREEVSPVIINALKILYNKKITTPYLSKYTSRQ